MVIDAQCHAGTGDGLTGPWDTAAPLDKYLVRAASDGIDGIVLYSRLQTNTGTGELEPVRRNNRSESER